METYTTKSGRTIVFRGEDAGFPEVFAGMEGDWFFEPKDYDGIDNPFSIGFPSAEEALRNAEDWEWDAEQKDRELAEEAERESRRY